MRMAWYGSKQQRSGHKQYKATLTESLHCRPSSAQEGILYYTKAHLPSAPTSSLLYPWRVRPEFADLSRWEAAKESGNPEIYRIYFKFHDDVGEKGVGLKK